MEIIILMKVGQIFAAVKKDPAVRSDFVIRSPTATASVRGTDFSMSYNKESGESVVSVSEGRVEVAAKKSWYKFWKKPTIVEVEAGQKATVSKKQDIKIEILYIR